MYRITTVCTGNICRSPMAEHLLRAALQDAGLEGVDVDSAGTSDWEIGRPMDPRAAELLTRHGLDPSHHVARQFTAEDFAGTDLVLALDTDHFGALRRMAGNETDRSKVHMLRSFDPSVAQKAPTEQGIYDPWYGDEADFAITEQLINAALPGLVRHIRTRTAETREA